MTVALLAGACAGGSSDTGADVRTVSATPGGDDRASLTGAGSTFAATVVEEWARLYRERAPGVEIAYEAIGSVSGVSRLWSGAADFTVTEVPMSAEEQRAAGSARALQIPLVGAAVAIVYNLPGVEALRLSEDTLARIFSGAITRWDHPAIRRDNPDRELPSAPVVPVHRSDGSGTTLAFTRYLGIAGPEVWAPGAGTSVDWPAGRGAAGSSGMVAAVGGATGAIGYVAGGPAASAGLQVASVRNSTGAFVAPSAVAVDATLLEATGFEDDLRLAVPVRQQSPTAYPIAAISHLVFREGLPREKDVALRHFAMWILTEGQRNATRLGFAPLPLPLLVRTFEGVLTGEIRPRR